MLLKRGSFFLKLLISIAGILITLMFLDYLWKEKRWRYIVIHHSASDVGNLEYYKKLHQEERGWDDIAYHFVINNGSMGTIPGQIEESDLWKQRKSGYSTKNWLVNTFGIAIVVVGNLENHPPLPQQYEALLNLVYHLSEKYDIPVERIFGHREIQNTKCPGRYLNMAKFRKDLERMREEKKRKKAHTR